MAHWYFQNIATKTIRRRIVARGDAVIDHDWKASTVANPAELTSLRDLLNAQTLLEQRGYRFEPDGGDTILVYRGTHLRGIWRCVNGAFAWTPAGYVEPAHVVRGVDGALRHTLVVLATSP